MECGTGEPPAGREYSSREQAANGKALAGFVDLLKAEARRLPVSPEEAGAVRERLVAAGSSLARTALGLGRAASRRHPQGRVRKPGDRIRQDCQEPWPDAKLRRHLPGHPQRLGGERPAKAPRAPGQADAGDHGLQPALSVYGQLSRRSGHFRRGQAGIQRAAEGPARGEGRRARQSRRKGRLRPRDDDRRRVRTGKPPARVRESIGDPSGPGREPGLAPSRRDPVRGRRPGNQPG